MRVLAALTFLVLANTSVFAQAVDPSLLSGLKARSIGPAAMSGRITSIDGWARDPSFILVGTASGGVWRSDNSGLNWRSVFDDQPVHSIGSVKIHPDHPDVLWVGSGEGNPRNSSSGGNGIYKSIDGGRAWKHMGLERTERIHRVLLDPKNPDTVYAAALGRMWGENSERGVYRSTDGGATWDRVLYIDERTGCADLIMDPRNPKKMIAAMWDYRRWPWSFRSGGPGSGLYITYDGGKNWRRLEAGLPSGPLGRMGLAVAPSDPKIVYAYVEATEENALYRSEDGGESWRKVSQGDNVGNRPFYYADLRVDPQDPNRVYSLWSLVSVSKDGGKNFEVLVNWNVHPDHHAMWINPNDPKHIIDGNDGGLAITRDHGQTWRFVRNLPLAQFYHVRVDNDVPYNVYGGLQDNGSWRGPSSVWEGGGIRNHHWQEVAFGDGFDTVPDPRDSKRGYAMSQGGALMRWDLRTGVRKNIQPTGPVGTRLRFNWNAAIAMHPKNPDTIYFGSQFVHRSRDAGESWEIISEDLTTNDPEWQRQRESGGLTLDVTDAENYTSLVSLAVSPLDTKVIWTGSDDGRLHVSQDDGKSWTSVERNVPEVPRNSWIPHIHPSSHNSGTAFVVFDDHRRSNWTPYMFRTSDFGRSWERLSIEGVRGYALSIVQDPEDPKLLFLGTELGLYVSVTGGSSWFQFSHGVPTSSVMDLALQEREADLVVATHGRGVFIVDDIRPLRGLNATVLAAPLTFFEPPTAQQYWRGQPRSSRFPASGEFNGTNRRYGALLSFATNGEVKGKVAVTVADADGEVIRTFEVPAQKGLNRVRWDLRRDGNRRPSLTPPAPDAPRPGGADALPGVYSVTLKLGEHTATREVTVLADPRWSISIGDRRANLKARENAGLLGERVAEAIDRITAIRADVAAAEQRAHSIEGEDRATFDASVKSLREALIKAEKQLWTPPGGKGITSDDSAMSQLGSLGWRMSSTWERPTAAHLELMSRAEQAISAGVSALNEVVASQYGEFRSQVKTLRIELAPSLEPLGG